MNAATLYARCLHAVTASTLSRCSPLYKKGGSAALLAAFPTMEVKRKEGNRKTFDAEAAAIFTTPPPAAPTRAHVTQVLRKPCNQKTLTRIKTPVVAEAAAIFTTPPPAAPILPGATAAIRRQVVFELVRLRRKSARDKKHRPPHSAKS